MSARLKHARVSLLHFFPSLHSLLSPFARSELPFRAVWTLSWPVIVSMLSYTALALVDAGLVSHLGTTPLAAMGLASTAGQLALAFGMGLLRGSKATVAFATGAGNLEDARRLGWQVLWLSLGLGLPVLMLAPLGPQIFAAFGASPGVVAIAHDVFALRAAGAPLLFTMIGMSAWFQGRGDTRTPMRATLISNVATILVDPALVLGIGAWQGMGASGAAVGFNFGAALGAAYLLRHALPLMREGRRWGAGLDLPLLKRILAVGSPLGLNFLLDIGSYAVFAALLAGMGEAGLAAHVLVIRMISVSFLPGFAIGEATGVLVGQSLGAGQPQRAYQSWRASNLLAMGIMGGFGLLFITIPGPLLAPFQPAPDVEHLARNLLFIAAIFQLFDAYLHVAQGALNGAGDTRFGMVMSLVVCWGIKLPLGAALALWAELGATGAWLGILGEVILACAAFGWRVHRAPWARRPADSPESDNPIQAVAVLPS